MSKYANAVKVRRAATSVWRADCPACGESEVGIGRNIVRCLYRWAAQHAAVCSELHWANWAAACPSCRRKGTVAPDCPVCLGRGHIVEREDLS